MTELVNKWSKAYFIDLGERVLATMIYGIITLITMDNVFERLDWERLWPVVVLPTTLALLKGLLANLAHAQSGASAVSGPPGPVLRTDGGRIP